MTYSTYLKIVVGIGGFIFIAQSPMVLADSTTPEFIYGQAYQAINPASLTGIDQSTQNHRSWSGAFQYTIPITLPPGRNQFTPQLSLQYNNQDIDQSSWLGIGWSVSIPSIERLNIYGVTDMYTRTDFTSSREGKLSVVSLSDTQHGIYEAETDSGSNAGYTYNTDDSWQVIDANGITYVYGATADSRIDDPDDSSVIFAWYLSSITDTNGNVITYTYSKDQGQIYPETITYADHFTVQFGLAGRDDQLTRFTSGFEVRTYYVIDTVTVKVDGTTVREYALDYEKPGDGRERSLLNSVTETGYDDAGTATSLPPTTFAYQSGVGGWVKDTSWSVPMYFSAYGTTTVPEDSGTRVFDVNGDDLPDLVYAVDDYSSPAGGTVWINTGSGWSVDTAYVLPVGFVDRGMDIGTRVADVNGDGYVDLIRGYGGTESSHYEANGVYLNDPDGKTWTLDTSYSVPMDFVVNPGSTPQGTSARLVDVNGDNLPDFIASIESSAGVYSGTGSVSINNGHGWTTDSEYNIPIPIGKQVRSDIATDLGVQFSDVNGDGLTDLINGSKGVYINQGLGKTWTLNTTYHSPGDFVEERSGLPSDAGLRLLDINGDHLDDIGYAYTSYTGYYDGTSFGASINYTDGNWFTADDSDYPIPVGFIQQSGSGPYVDEGTRFGDVNGDGMVDLIKDMSHSPAEADNGVYLNQGDPADLLTSVQLPTGGSLSVTYQTPTPADNPNVQYPVQVVTAITADDGLGHTSTTDYSYTGGAQYGSSVEDRQFAGFATIIEETENRTITYHYSQGSADKQTIGKISQVDIANASGTPVATTFTDWEVTDKFVYPTQTVTLYYNSDGTHYDTANTYSYDTSNDNLLTTIDYGHVTATTSGDFSDTTGDTYTTTNTYATPTSGSSITTAVASKTFTNNAGTQLRQTRYSYDDLDEGSVTAGNATSERVWISGTTYAETTYTYTSYGLRATITDPLTHTTTKVYGTDYLWPTSVIDALGNSTSYAYDSDSGAVTSTTDPNGAVNTTVYDGLNRPIERDQSSATTAGTTEMGATWSYDMTSVPNVTLKTDWLDGGVSVLHYQYVDGLSRAIQQRNEMDGSDSWSVSDTSYNAEGLVATTSLPYSTSGSAYSSPTSETTLLSQTTYDPLNRPTSNVTALGTTTHTYTNWEDAVVDSAGKTKTYTYNARNELMAVTEKIAGTNYTTMYTLDGSNLTKIQDASGNIRNFTYDGRGLRLTGQDLHSSSDSAYGSNSSTYDDNGQIDTFTDANGSTTTSTYDELNRLLTRGDETYSYDTCTNGIGRVCGVTVGSDVSTTYTYDLLGRVTGETKTIKGTTYTTAHTYDRQNNILTLTYPDSSIATHTYNAAGQLATTTFYDARKSTTTTLVSAVSYAPIGKPSSITYGSGSTTSLSYDSAKLYRVSNKNTTNASTTLQDLTYAYDAVNNITGITDAATIYTGVSYTYTYDDAYRLKTAQAVQGTTTLYNHTMNYSATGHLTSATGLGTYMYGGTAAGNYANPHAVTRLMGKTYTYDRNGNQTGDGTWTNTWNTKNQLTNQVNGALSYTYVYDHTGNRAHKTKVNSIITTISVYPNEYYDIEGAYYRRHISHPTLGTIATNTYFSTRRTSTLIYHLTDHLGSTAVDTNSTGTYQEYVLYFPFGKIKTDSRVSGAVNNDYKFTGQELDDTNLYYYGARYYNPTMFTFLSQDPAPADLSNPQNLNNYSYGLNNPVRYNDPSGAWNNDTLKYGGIQLLHSGMNALSTIDTIFATAWMITKGNFIGSVAGVGSGLATMDDMFVDMGNGINNTVNGFQNEQVQNIQNAGPIRDTMSLIPGANDWLSASQKIYGIASLTGSTINLNPQNIKQAITAGVEFLSQALDVGTGSDLIETVADHQYNPSTSTQSSTSTGQTTTTGSIKTNSNTQQPSSTTVTIPHSYVDSPTSIHSSSFAKQSSRSK